MLLINEFYLHSFTKQWYQFAVNALFFCGAFAWVLILCYACYNILRAHMRAGRLSVDYSEKLRILGDSMFSRCEYWQRALLRHFAFFPVYHSISPKLSSNTYELDIFNEIDRHHKWRRQVLENPVYGSRSHRKMLKIGRVFTKNPSKQSKNLKYRRKQAA